MSNFIELTNYYGNGDVVLINVDHVVSISCHNTGGAVLVEYNGHAMHVCESYNMVKQLIRGRKCLIENVFSHDVKEEFMSIVCYKICRYRDAASNQDDLNKICENCPLVNFFEVM